MCLIQVQSLVYVNCRFPVYTLSALACFPISFLLLLIFSTKIYQKNILNEISISNISWQSKQVNKTDFAFSKGRILHFGVDLRQNRRATCSRRRNVHVRSVIKLMTYLLMQRTLRRERVSRIRNQPLSYVDDMGLILR